MTLRERIESLKAALERERDKHDATDMERRRLKGIIDHAERQQAEAINHAFLLAKALDASNQYTVRLERAFVTVAKALGGDADVLTDPELEAGKMTCSINDLRAQTTNMAEGYDELQNLLRGWNDALSAACRRVINKRFAEHKAIYDEHIAED